MRARLAWQAMAASALLAGGCARCGRAPAVPAERWLPGDASAALLVPRLGDAVAEWGGLLRTALSIPAASGLAEPYAALKQQLGFDPLDPAGLAAAGLDPDRGGGASLSREASALLALPVADPARLDALLTRLARDRLGAGVRTEAGTGSAAVVVYRRAEGAPPALSYAVVERMALVSPGPRGLEVVAAAAARGMPLSLAGNAAFRTARTAIGDGLTALAFAPAGSPLLADLAPCRDGAALGIRGGATGLELRLYLALPPERAEVWQEVAGGAPPAGDGAPLAPLPADAFAAARFDGDPAALGRRISYLLPPRLGAWLRQSGLDLRRDLFDLLAPGAWLALSVAPTFRMDQVARGADPSADPFRLVHLGAAARVRDPGRLRAALDRASRAASPGRPARPRPDGIPTWSVPLGGGALDLGLRGDQLLVGGGPGRLEALLVPPGPGFAAPTPASRAALERGVGAAVSFGALVRSIRALPPEAFGTGPDGFVMRALADRFLDPAARLSAASGRLEVLPGAARLLLTVEAAPP